MSGFILFGKSEIRKNEKIQKEAKSSKLLNAIYKNARLMGKKLFLFFIIECLKLQL